VERLERQLDASVPALDAADGRKHLEFRPRKRRPLHQRRIHTRAGVQKFLDVAMRRVFGDQDGSGFAQQATPRLMPNPGDPPRRVELDVDGDPVAAQRVVDGRGAVRPREPADAACPARCRNDRVLIEVVQGRPPISRNACGESTSTSTARSSIATSHTYSSYSPMR